MAHPDHLFDKRIVERSIQRGTLKTSEVQQMLAALPDVSHNAQRNEAHAEPAASPQPAVDPYRSDSEG